MNLLCFHRRKIGGNACGSKMPPAKALRATEELLCAQAVEQQMAQTSHGLAAFWRRFGRKQQKKQRGKPTLWWEDCLGFKHLLKSYSSLYPPGIFHRNPTKRESLEHHRTQNGLWKGDMLVFRRVLVGVFWTHLKHISQHGKLPQIGGEHKKTLNKYLKLPPSIS